MSTAESSGDPNKDAENPANPGQDNDSVASKLSRELTNWRRRRTSTRPRLADGSSQGFQSEPARTIKVRGHETLVVRKPKLVAKPPQNHTPSTD
ncbi:MAG TPA: hypothetical protein VIX59_04610 [Candidatus Binataceae bacterium]